MNNNILKHDINDLQSNIEKFIYLYQQYINDSKYVYKSCKYFVIVLVKYDETKTNETRHVLDHRFAIFRGDYFMVEKIINKFDPTHTISEISSYSYDCNMIKYVVGSTVKSRFNLDNNRIRADGIQYWKSIEPAYYDNLYKYSDSSPMYIKSYYDSGMKQSECLYINEKIDGNFRYYENNEENCIKYEIIMVNGIRHGLTTCYYKDNKLISEFN
jgi:hypothetical protein